MSLPAGERAAFLDHACGDDSDLRGEVGSLLAHDRADDGDDFLAEPAAADAARLLLDADSRSLVGQRIGPFEIVAAIGAGGMGEVYAAHDARLDRQVALKRIPSHLAADLEHVERFRREALASSALNHPNIVTVHGIVEHEGMELLVTELVDGVTLRERMRDGALPLREALEISLQIARGLSAAHASGIVHRDIKPENVMVRRDGLVKVLDFGVAKWLRPALADAAGGTTPGELIGTVGYMSPEQARGLPVDARTDVWSLGVVLYELVTHEAPFGGATPSDRLAAILERQPVPAGRRRRGLPAAFDRVLRRALCKDAATRYEHAGELADDLDRLLDEMGRTPLARPRWIVAALLAAAIAAVAVRAAQRRLAAVAEASRPAIRSVAVLPFHAVGDRTDDEFLGTGLAEALIRRLGALADVTVRPLGAAERLSRAGLAPREVGRRLGVEAVLAGTVRRDNDRVRVSATLHGVRDGRSLWTGVITEPSGLLQAQETLWARLLAGVWPAADARAAPAWRTSDAQAYEHYLRGRHFWNQRTQASLERAVSHFERAIERDPGFAAAYAMLADAHVLLRDGPDPHTHKRLARAAVEKALALDDRLGEAHSVLGMQATFDFDWQRSEREYRLAAELAPGDPTGWHRLGELLALRGRFDEGLTALEHARRIDPQSAIIAADTAKALFFARRFEEAEREARRALEIQPDSFHAHLFRGVSLAYLGRREEALAEADRCLQVEPSLVGRTLGGVLFGFLGEASRAEALLDEVVAAGARGDTVPDLAVAGILVTLRRKGEALDRLERAYREGGTLLGTCVNPIFDSLRSEPRFQKLCTQLGETLPDVGLRERPY